MKILYDHQAFEIQKRGGVSRYFSTLINQLYKIKNAHVESTSLYLNNEYLKSPATSENFTDYITLSDRTLSHIKSRLRRYKSIVSLYLRIKMWMQRLQKLNSVRKLKRQDFDIFHPTYYDGYFLKYLGQKPFVVTVFDMMHEIYPEYFSNQDRTSDNKRLLTKHASRIIAISHNTKKDLVKYFGIASEKITVIHLANLLDTRQEEALDIPSRYILYVGGRKRFKNFDFFIKSIAPIMHGENDLHIICAGGDAFDSKELALFDNLSLRNKIIQHTVNDKQLTYLYKNAEFFIFPSLYEGFGLPIMEAFACKCPIAISDASCFPEIAGDAALYFNPQSEDSIAQTIKKMLHDEELRKNLVEKGTKRLTDFSKEKMAQETYQVYNDGITMHNKKRIFVTGGLGFIGSNFIQMALDRGYHVINIDKKTYAARTDLDFDKNPNYEFIYDDICNLKSLPKNITHIVNFAAESHVDNSLKATADFFRSNVQGVYNILELLKKEDPRTRPVLIQISTDEVYGDRKEGSSIEINTLRPSSPYSATKAAADQLVFGWGRSHDIKYRICRSSNNYGYGQHPEKLIPRTIKYAYKNLKMEVHGDGSYQREWIQVEDNCEGILLVMEKGEDGEIYNISTGEMWSNLEVVKMILRAMGKPEDFFVFVKNRSGQDLRYSVDPTKIKQLGWKPKHTLDEYLPKYLELCEIGRLQHRVKKPFLKRVLHKITKK